MIFENIVSGRFLSEREKRHNNEARAREATEMDNNEGQTQRREVLSSLQR
jgi:hypothetical protein